MAEGLMKQYSRVGCSTEGSQDYYNLHAHEHSSETCQMVPDYKPGHHLELGVIPVAYTEIV